MPSVTVIPSPFPFLSPPTHCAAPPHPLFLPPSAERSTLGHRPPYEAPPPPLSISTCNGIERRTPTLPSPQRPRRLTSPGVCSRAGRGHPPASRRVRARACARRPWTRRCAGREEGEGEQGRWCMAGAGG